MAISVQCPGCGRTRTVPDDWAGRSVVCNDCQTPHVVPSLGTNDPLPPFPSGPPPVPPAAPPLPGVRPSPPTARPPLPLPGEPAPEGQAGPAIRFDRLFQALAEAMSLRKLGFFMGGMAATWVVVLLLLWLAAASKSLAGLLVVVPLVTILALRMSGVLAGGVAYMLRAKAEGRPESIGETCGFCGQRFLSLFGGMLLVLFALGLISVVVNGIIALLAGVQGLSLLAAALFIPQVLFNLVLALAALTIVLVPCAIARREIGAIEAL